MKVTINFSKLKGLIREKGMSQTDLAKAIGIGANSINQKLNNKRDFTLMETVAISKVLGITDPVPYFFDAKLP